MADLSVELLPLAVAVLYVGYELGRIAKNIGRLVEKSEGKDKPKLQA